MPTYEYECLQCQHQFERYQPITARPIRKCEKCGGKTRRLIGAGGGILFKGSGFYQTDYRSEGYKKKAESEKQKPSSGSGGDQKKSDLSKSKSSEKSSSPPTKKSKSEH